MLDSRFVILGILIMLIGDLSYLILTLLGKIKPNKVSLLLWSLAPFLAFFAERQDGIELQSYMTLSVGLATFAIFVASFVNKKAQWKLGLFDYICGALSLAGLFLWLITGVGYLAIFFAILADIFACIPTLKKSFYYPETENFVAYLGTGINGIITILTFKSWSFAAIGFPLYTALINTIFILLIKFKLGKKLS